MKIMNEAVGNEEYLNLEEGVSTASKLFEGDGIGFPSSSGVNVMASLNMLMSDVDQILECVSDGDMDMAEKLFNARLLKHQQQYDRYSETLASEIKNLMAGLEKADQMSQKIRKFANDVIVFQGGNLNVR